MMQYGLNFPVSSIKKMRERQDISKEGVRTWGQLLGSAGLSFETSASANLYDYSTAIQEAYKSNLLQQRGIQGAGLTQAFAQEASAINKQELSAIYDTYRQNYAQNLSSNIEQYNKELGSIDEALTQGATNISKLLGESAYKYLSEELYGSYLLEPGKGVEKTRTEGEGRKAKVVGTGEYEDLITDYFADKTGREWMFDKSGNLRSWEELATSIVDENNQITERGIEFYDMLLNATPHGYQRGEEEEATTTRSFDRWLAETDPELREWLANEDLFNWTEGGKMSDTFREMLGIGEKYSEVNYLNKERQEAFTKVADTEVFDFVKAYNELKPDYRLAGGGMLQSDWRNKQSELANALKQYYTDAFTNLGATEKAFRKYMGDDAWNAFAKENEALFTQFEEAQKKATTALQKNDYETMKSQQTESAKAYNTLIAKMKTEVTKQNVAPVSVQAFSEEGHKKATTPSTQDFLDWGYNTWGKKFERLVKGQPTKGLQGEDITASDRKFAEWLGKIFGKLTGKKK